MATTIVRCFLRARGRILLYRQGSSGERWTVPSDDSNCAYRETARALAWEWGFEDATLVRVGTPLEIEGSQHHPYLFDCDPRRVNEHEAEWVHATEIRERETADGLWRAYRVISPTVEDVRNDDAHGSAYISIRALELLRDRASDRADWQTLFEYVTELLEAHPSMAALENRINRAMSEASETARAGALESSTKKEIDRQLRRMSGRPREPQNRSKKLY
jgi:hypothetical protein